MQATAIKYLKKLDRILDHHWLLMAALLVLVALRIPNFYEPYWYGDEAIYLTIGQALNKGEALYSQIVDHKTPIIYLLARVGTQENFRILNFFWMSTATILFYIFSWRITARRLAAGMATLLFVLFTTLPWFEGHIPNGELFVIGFVMLGAVALSYTSYFKKLLSAKTKLAFNTKEVLLLIAAGISFGLAILTKVPALFDLAGFATIGFFFVTNKFTLIGHKLQQWRSLLFKVVGQWFWLLIGTAIPIVASVIFFIIQGSGADYLQFGLLYNIYYAGNWGLPFENTLLLAAFSLPGKFIIATALILLIAYLKKYFSSKLQFIFAWFVLALFASLLSNRPYPHYFLQVIPPLSLLVGITLKDWVDLIRSKRSFTTNIGATSLLAISAVALFSGALLLLNVGFYQVKAYYQDWYDLWSGQISKAEYNQRFNGLMDDNYQAAEIIRQSGVDHIFIWGDNPMLYALSGASPTGKFTVAFHIKDLEVYDQTLADLKAKAPKYIVVMDNQGNNFPGFYSYLHQNYQVYSVFDHFSLWRKTADAE